MSRYRTIPATMLAIALVGTGILAIELTDRAQGSLDAKRFSWVIDFNSLDIDYTADVNYGDLNYFGYRDPAHILEIKRAIAHLIDRDQAISVIGGVRLEYPVRGYSHLYPDPAGLDPLHPSAASAYDVISGEPDFCAARDHLVHLPPRGDGYRFEDADNDCFIDSAPPAEPVNESSLTMFQPMEDMRFDFAAYVTNLLDGFFEGSVAVVVLDPTTGLEEFFKAKGRASYDWHIIVSKWLAPEPDLYTLYGRPFAFQPLGDAPRNSFTFNYPSFVHDGFSAAALEFVETENPASLTTALRIHSEFVASWSVVSFGPPGAPGSLQAEDGDSQVNLSWQPPPSDGGLPVFAYRIYRRTQPEASAFLVEVDDVLAFTDTNVTNGVPYYYRVTAVNAQGEGLRSNEARAIPMAPPPPPPPPPSPPSFQLSPIGLLIASGLVLGAAAVAAYVIWKRRTSRRS